jgi:hypothetical protein
MGYTGLGPGGERVCSAIHSLENEQAKNPGSCEQRGPDV